MTKKTNIWLIRVYAIVILILLFGDFLEGAAFNLITGLASLAIIVQSFLLNEN